MNLELDKRIKAITDIKSVTDGCHDWEFMTKKGYFANSIFDFKDLEHTCVYGEYTEYREHDQCFLCEIDHYDGTFDHSYYRYFIPEDVLLPEEKPEKKYRPYSLEEFLKIFKVGDQIGFRSKDNGEVKYAMLVGYTDDFFADNTDRSDGENDVMIGIYRFSLSYLFENYDLYFEDEWQPFGVIDEDKE